MNIKKIIKDIAPESLKSSFRKSFPRIGMSPINEFEISADAEARAKKNLRNIYWPKSGRKIIYALVPTPNLKNVGDQAQAVAILKWLKRTHPNMHIIELDKDICVSCIDELKSLINNDDIIYLHSGGNLGDRAKWSEVGRRRIIAAFKSNKIISLPQTIYFSDTAYGKYERSETSKIYSAHPDLTIFGRDKASGKIAESMFPTASVRIAPDFVLSLNPAEFVNCLNPSKGTNVLACLREDDESIFTPKQRMNVSANIPGNVTLFDTDVENDINSEERESILSQTLQVFNDHDIVVTDRYHGLIFSVLCGKPTVVLRTVDHKLTSAIEWFDGIENVVFCKSVDDIPSSMKKARSAVVNPMAREEFNKKYFDVMSEEFSKI